MNKKPLIIVESPNKIQTIKSFIGDNCDVLATVGHIRELNKKNGFNKETFDPYWSVIVEKNGKSKNTIIKDIKKHASEASTIYLATDPDREGEAISWHVYDLFDQSIKSKCVRITFNELTKNAVKKAIEDGREIDINLVQAQFSRSILDRIVGYGLSSLVKSKLSQKSAGRVQSVALLFLVKRELEKRAFVPSFWWEINPVLECGLKLELKKNNINYLEYDSKTSSFSFSLENDANTVLKSLDKLFELVEIKDIKNEKGVAKYPITTDKLLQLASNKLGWDTKKTTRIAQNLFEGISIDNDHKAFISYPRTDSERLSDDFINQSKEYIKTLYGEQYLIDQIAQSKNKTNNIQDAHEAIRPIDLSTTPASLVDHMPNDELKLYDLIWSETMAILIKPPVFNQHSFVFNNNGYTFNGSYRTIKFDGYYILDKYQKTKEEYVDLLPNPILNNKYPAHELKIDSKEKKPPSNYTEASLISALKESGVGRPSTYATMASIGVERGYVEKNNKQLMPNDIGIEVSQFLEKFFPNIISPEFTAKMEDSLDEIADGKLNWKKYLHDFKNIFDNDLKHVKENVSKKEDEKCGRNCPDCGSELVYKMSKYKTRFIGCSNFPNCKYIEPEKQPEISDNKCPKCDVNLIIRTSKKSNKKFLGCPNFPNCDYIADLENKPITVRRKK